MRGFSFKSNSLQRIRSSSKPGAERYLSSAFLDKSLRIKSDKDWGNSLLIEMGEGGLSAICAWTSSTGSFPKKGRRPVKSSKNVIPNE